MTITKKTQKTNTLLIDSDEDVVNTHEISDSFKKSESSIKSTNKEVSHEHEVTDDTSQVLTEKELIENVERRNTNFVFLFGGPKRGKTVITSSVLNFMSRAESEGNLKPVGLLPGVDNYGNTLLRNLRNVFANRGFPERTALVGQQEPIYVDICFTPQDKRDKTALNLTFLEMPGDVLKNVHVPNGGRGTLPKSINAFFKAKEASISFILVTEVGSETAGDDQLLSDFIEYIQEINPRFDNSRFLLLVTKWDRYDQGLSVDKYVETNMPITYSKLLHSNHSISHFTIGKVIQVDGKDFLQEYDPIPAKLVINWIWKNITGHPLYSKTFMQKLIQKIRKIV